METESPILKIVKRKIKKCPNPLFEKWLKEWKEEANKNGSEMQYCFNKALKSLQKFPFELKTGKECIMLENFGSRICQMLDKKLEEHNELHKNGKLPLHNQHDAMEDTTVSKLKAKKKSNGEAPESKISPEAEFDASVSVHIDDNYKPSFRSGAYAILVAMYEKSQEKNFKGFLTKSEIQHLAQKYCDSSFTMSKLGSHYTAWSSMTTLIQKKLVEKKGNPNKFSLTMRGNHIASKMKSSKIDINQKASDLKSHSGTVHVSADGDTPNQKSVKLTDHISPVKAIIFENRITLTSKVPDNIPLNKKKIEETNEVNEILDEPIFMLSNRFKIILLVDNQERDNKFQQSNQMTMRQLKSRNVDYEIRHLKVGDFIWIARNTCGQELVLPYIVERKRMDDLASSIKDGRFHEQKFRLKQSGIQNLIYLVENYGTDNQKLGLPLPTLMQAISNTQIVGHFTVRITNDHNHSMRYLDIMTTQLNNIFKNKTLMSCKKSDVISVALSNDLIPLMTFQEFNKGSEKNKKATVRSTLVKHLLQLNGLSVEKAKAIVQLYPTPRRLMEALKESDGEKIISKLSHGNFNRAIGPVTAKQVKMLYTSLELS